MPTKAQIVASQSQRELEVRELRAALTRAQRAADRKVRDTAAYLQAIELGVHDAMLAHGPVTRVPRPRADRRAGKSEVALLHLTDWQLGKVSSSYSIAACQRRVMQAVDKTIKLTQIQRADHPVRECHVLFGGDMVEGVTIFPGQAYEIEASLFSQFVAVGNLCAAVVLKLLEHFDKVVVHEEKGNHGRIGRKGELPGSDNIDLMAYELARTIIGSANQSRVQWLPYAGPIGTHAVIGNYTALLVHGDEVQSFGGNTPAFGILRKANAWATGVVAPFTDVYMGHWHTPMTLTLANAGRVFVAGSPESDNEYAREFVAAVGKPSQRLNFINPQLGRVTAEYVLWLD